MPEKKPDKILKYQCSDPFIRGLKRIGRAYRKSGNTVDPDDSIAVLDLIVYHEALLRHGFKLPARVAKRGGKRPGAGAPKGPRRKAETAPKEK